MCNRLDTIPACVRRTVGQTDGRTDIFRRHSPRYAYASRGKQEAQLLQRDRATLRVIKYFAKSLKIIQGHSK